MTHKHNDNDTNDDPTRTTITHNTVQVDYNNGRRWLTFERFGPKSLYCGHIASEASIDKSHIVARARQLALMALNEVDDELGRT